MPPTNPVGLDPTKPGETTASAQQLLPGCYSETGRIVGVGADTAGGERYPVSKLGLISFNREVARSLPPQIEFEAANQTVLICLYPFIT